MFQPMLLPVALFLMGAYFVAFGLAGTKVKPEFEVELTGRAAADDKAKRKEQIARQVWKATEAHRTTIGKLAALVALLELVIDERLAIF